MRRLSHTLFLICAGDKILFPHTYVVNPLPARTWRKSESSPFSTVCPVLPQPPLPSISSHKRHHPTYQRGMYNLDGEDGGTAISREVAAPSSGLPDDHDSLQTDELNTCDSPQDETFGDFLAPRAPLSINVNEASVANLSLVPQAGLEHGSHPYEPV